MEVTGFSLFDFDTFRIEGLDGRMQAIQSRIQPKFKALGEPLAADLSALSGREMFVHIAKHARRKVNPPVDTWMALCGNKRGYKMVPHFQVGLFDDRLFVWLAYIYELPQKKQIAETFLRQLTKVRKQVPADFLLSFDHMNKDAISAGGMKKAEWTAALTRFRDVKSAELLIGRQLAPDDPIVSDGVRLVEFVKSTFEQLMPLYRMSGE